MLTIFWLIYYDIYIDLLVEELPVNGFFWFSEQDQNSIQLFIQENNGLKVITEILNKVWWFYKFEIFILSFTLSFRMYNVFYLSVRHPFVLTCIVPSFIIRSSLYLNDGLLLSKPWISLIITKIKKGNFLKEACTNIT
jgi:hypothetical protein